MGGGREGGGEIVTERPGVLEGACVWARGGGWGGEDYSGGGRMRGCGVWGGVGGMGGGEEAEFVGCFCFCFLGF